MASNLSNRTNTSAILASQRQRARSLRLKKVLTKKINKDLSRPRYTKQTSSSSLASIPEFVQQEAQQNSAQSLRINPRMTAIAKLGRGEELNEEEEQLFDEQLSPQLQRMREIARQERELQDPQDTSQIQNFGAVAAVQGSTQAQQQAEKIAGDRVADLLYTNLIPSWGLTLIPLNAWMMGYFPKKFGELRGPYVFKSKISGVIVVLFCDFLIAFALGLAFLQFAIMAWAISNPIDAVLQLGDIIIKAFTG